LKVGEQLCLRLGTAATNPCTLNTIPTSGDLYKQLCIHQLSALDLATVNNSIKGVIEANRKWRKPVEGDGIDISKLVKVDKRYIFKFY